jgi:hypothetical protein
MKGYLERHGKCFRVSYDTLTKSFVDVPIDQLRFMPGNLLTKFDEKPVQDEPEKLRHAAE